MRQDQMEEALDEARELITRLEQGILEPDLEPEERNQMELVLRPILRDREAWLQGRILVLTSEAQILPDAELGKGVKSKLQSVEDGAQMLTKPEAIEYLRSLRSMNHEPLRKIEREWLDRVFVRERMSKGWLGIASVVATAEEQGIHIEESFPVPCKCLDSVQRKRRNRNP